MNFDIKDINGNTLHLTYGNVIDNGTIRVNGRRWFTLTDNVQQSGGNVLYANYPFGSWTADGQNYNRVSCITVNPLQSGDVDIYID